MNYWIYSLTFVIAGLSQCSHGQNLMANFHMEGITGAATLTWAANQLSVALNMQENLGMTTVEIHPIWVNYDGMNKCSNDLLGSTLEGLSETADVQGSVTTTVTYSNVPSLYYVEGHSLVLKTSTKLICATIQRNENHVTAIVKFRGAVFGHVYLRQPNVSGSSTRIVSDLATQTDTHTGSWRITNSYRTCEQLMEAVLVNIYDPSSSGSNGCSTANQNQCAIGDLSSKLGDAYFPSSMGSSMGRRAYTDSNLPLYGDNNVDNLLMVIIPENRDIKPSCGKINVYAARSAKATFSNDGVTGTIEFVQRSPLDSTVTNVNLEGLNSQAGGYHVHMFPVPEREASSQGSMCAPERVSGHFNPFEAEVGIPSSPSYPSALSSTYDKYEVGDLSAKYGLLNGLASKSATYTDYNLQLFGQNSIVGRSLVIHRNDATKSRWVCVNIEPQYPVIAAEALFLYPVIGRVMFMQERDDPESETSVFTSLDYIDETPDSQGHTWMVGSMALGNDMLESDDASRCVSAGSAYNPERLWLGMTDRQYTQVCSDNKPVACKTGDLSGKLGPLSIGNAAASQDEAKKWFATDINLPLSGPHSVIGKPVVIRNVENSASLACAGIKPVHPVVLVARLTAGPVTGTVRFSQSIGFGSKRTMVNTDLSGLTDGQSLKIHELPTGDGDSACSDLGTLFDPLEVGDSQPSITTDDKYKVGDLSRFASMNEWSSYNLPLFGVNSVKGRSVAAVDQSNVLGCATIDWDLAGWTRVDAVATFTGDINGKISMYQHLHPDGAMSDTTFLTDLEYANSSLHSLNHNWHTHQKVVSGDSQSPDQRCMSTGPHYNPFTAAIEETAYATKCSRVNQLRCELGDQAKKTMTIDVGRDRKLHTDTYEPLIGKFSVLSRSIVVHVENKGAPRLACADIRPDGTPSVTVTFKTPATFSGLSEAEKIERISKTYADATRSYPGEVIVVIERSNQEETIAVVHFLGTRSAKVKSRFVDYINDDNRRDNLGQFVPILNSADSTSINIILILFAVVASVLSSLMSKS